MTLTKSKGLSAILLSLAMVIPLSVQATVVEVRTVLGNFEVNLFDETTPKTVENFLSYVNSGEYANGVVHRTQANFVMQAGGFTYNNVFPPTAIQTGAAVVNEPVLSNVRGTIAMAKVGGNVNSATSQWFINVSNNAANLDVQNGGFTVFGQVLGNGMEIVDAIANTPNFDYGAPFTTIPLREFTSADKSAGIVPTDSNLVMITDIVSTNTAVVTNPSLNPAPNTLLAASNENASNDSDSGGSMGTLLVLLLAATAFRRRLHKV
ncbi:peptidylprolyl isomerase [Brumicola pallidula]|jgi:peptidyl-prolyl cis-trans isomerase A (cyclophilin A)|uniref:Peptidyl-prolyl cis-trans isomerase n=1 Tax=Brumicola pallidula DSM 14239 = ACAM 615 TaxID=1121922 RepID=K6Y2M2_9ALTE|nr:peptidylprolyl isomerase [Glaciecola pallidula]GAC27074.1 peptidyl-prolyl cis-trans isomerase A [Glaciecola pallidula DSM 14239 = ACAM 615]